MRLALSVKYEYAPSALSSTASNATYERVRRQRSEPRAEPSDAARHSAVGGDGRRRPAAQPISHAADRLDAVVRGVAELLPQVADVHLDVVLVAEEGVAPHLVEDALARQHLVGVGCEIQEQVELARRQLERAFPRAHLARGGVDAEIAGTDDACQLRAAPAEHRPNARQQLAELERFDDVVVGAELETLDTIRRLVARAEDDDPARPVAGERTAELPPVHSRHHQVEHDEVRPELVD